MSELDRAQQALDDSRAVEASALLTTADCARALGVTAAFIRGEVRGGRLVARVFERPSGRSAYRIRLTAFQSYVARYWPERTFHVTP